MKNNDLHLVLMSLLIVFVTTGLLHPLSVENSNEDMDMDPELTGGFVEGDMIIDETRNTVSSPARKWPFCKVPYIISCKNYSPAQLSNIYQAFDIISGITGLQFVRISKPGPGILGYINITCIAGSCYAGVGFKEGPVVMNLQRDEVDKGCARLGVILHETLHALGFQHEQTSSNRDAFVEILWENILPDKITVFNKQSNTQFENLCADYDYGSIMHYGRFGFSKNKLPTIEPLQKNVTIGQRDGLSEIDICRLRKIYCNCFK